MVQRVVVAGAGFAGLNAARILSRQPFLEIIIIDRCSFHVFKPLLYQVAMGVIHSGDIIFPIRSLFRSKSNVRVISAVVSGFDSRRRVVKTSVGEVKFDYLIISCGAETAIPSKEGWAQNLNSLGSISDAMRIRLRVFRAFECASSLPEGDDQKSYLTFVIIGAGPTGVELAGELSALYHKRLKYDFKQVASDRVRIILLEGGDRILPSFSEKISSYVMAVLNQLKVEVRVRSTVQSMDARGVWVCGQFIGSRTVIWAAGVKPNALNNEIAKEFDVPTDRQSRVKVNFDLSLHRDSKVFLIGDEAQFMDPVRGELPGLAAVAIQQGAHVATQILNDHHGRPRQTFVFKNRGQLVVISDGLAAGQIGNFHLYGKPAWLLWAFVHLYELIGIKNRLFVFQSWIYSWLSRNVVARIYNPE